jgi:hypothetical protein
MRTLARFPALLTVSFLCFLAPAKANTTNNIVFGTNIANESIPTPGWTNYYVFAATSNDVIFAAVLNTGGSALPYLTLYDSTGAVVTTHYNTTSSAILRDYRLPKTDTYTLAVSDDASDQTFQYNLSFNVAKGGNANVREPGDDPEAMALGQNASGHISLADYDTYTFTATSNDVVFIALHSAGGGRYSYIFLYDSQGTVVAAHYGASYAALRNIQLPKTDTYTLAITEDGFDYE